LYGQGAHPLAVDLPEIPFSPDAKHGLDDYLTTFTSFGDAREALDSCLTAGTFPTVYNIGAWVHKELKNRRRDPASIARAITADMDKYGARYRTTHTKEFHYLDRNSKDPKLYSLALNTQALRELSSFEFGRLIIRRYKVHSPETEVLKYLKDQLETIEPIQEATPRKVSWCDDDSCYIQLSDYDVMKVNAQGIKVVQNGTGGNLFRSGVIKEPLDTDAVWTAAHAPFRNLWVRTRETLNLQPLPGMTLQQTRYTLAALFHLDPWLRHWRGLQLPIQLCIAEPTSGKTFLYNLYRGILTGSPQLDSLPSKVEDWEGNIHHAPAMWVGDNLNDIPKQMQSAIEQKIAHLVTEPEPDIVRRHLFTTIDQGRFPVDVTFAITAITSPFHKPDVTERSLTFRLEAIPDGQRDYMWYQRRLRDRVDWIGEQILVLNRFFRYVAKEWNENYMGNQRLVHFEQSMYFMLRAIGCPHETAAYIRNSLYKTQSEEIAANNPVVAALRAFSSEWNNPDRSYAYLPDIVSWAQADERYYKLPILSAERPLSIFVEGNKKILETSAYLKSDRLHNRRILRIITPPPENVIPDLTPTEHDAAIRELEARLGPNVIISNESQL